MTTISIVHTKGGVGKTTSAMFLATAAKLREIDTVVVDADPQGSATEWAERAAERGVLLPFEVQRPGKKLDIPDRDIVIVDTPPGTHGLIQSAIDAADLIVIPCGASPIDVERVWPTLDITQDRPTVVLLTQVDLRAKLSESVREVLIREGVPVMQTLIPQRQSTRRAFGTVPADLNGYTDALEELEGLMQRV